MASPLVVALGDAPSPAALEPEWRALEARADASFFTSWTWIGTWLRQLPAGLRPQLLRVTRGDEVMGLALFTPRLLRRHGFIRARSLFLHTTGDPSYDAITVEYNGLLIDRHCREEVERQVLEHLVTQAPGWEELYMEALAAPPQALQGRRDVLLAHSQRPSFHVDLCKVRAHRDGYLALLGQKPRYSVRRSAKWCTKEWGPVALDIADTPAQAREFLAGLKQLHSAYWHTRGQPGAFASPFANDFHDDLVLAGLAGGEVQLLHARAGDKTIGYLYNFVHRGRVLNYQAGINYAMFPSTESPGLLTHALAVQFNAEQGHSIYDFMMGDQRYKRSLCTDTAAQHWLVVRRNRLKFRLEDALRRARNRMHTGLKA